MTQFALYYAKYRHDAGFYDWEQQPYRIVTNLLIEMNAVWHSWEWSCCEKNRKPGVQQRVYDDIIMRRERIVQETDNIQNRSRSCSIL